jgi:glyoxylase-like metal-dependent hydrolase (beta-lactamase superfamily II)
MRKVVVTIAVVATVAVLTVRAQDARTTLDAAAKAIGSDSLTSLQFSGTGMNAAYGQAFRPGGPWPAFKVTSYTASINYGASAMRIELDRTNPDGKVEGGGGLPLVAPQKQIQVMSGRAAWNVANGAPAPALAALRDRQLALWTTPHGVIKAAIANSATVTGRVISFTVNGVNLQATLGADNLVSKVEMTTDAAVLGDTITETTYSNYGDFGGVKFPRRIVQKQGGFPILDLTITDVKPNAPVSIEVPQPVLQTLASPGVTPPVTVTTTKVGDGVFYLTGGSHHSMAVEFKDYSVIFEAPQTDERALAVLDATKKAIPNKPIRYVINSHNHFDHLGGIRAVMAEGITVITQTRNKEYYDKIATMPHTLSPDRLAKSSKKPVIETVDDKRVITDGTQTLEIYRLPSMHSETLLMGYLPKQKILYEVDVFNAPAAPTANAPASAVPPNPATVEFVANLEKMKLDVDQVLAGHGPRVVTMKDLRSSAGRVSTN